MKNMKKSFVALAAVTVVSGAALTACTANEAADTASDATEAVSSAMEEAGDAVETAAEEAEEEVAGEDAASVNARPNECGLQEQEGPSASFGPFDGAIAYFQPGEMLPNPGADMKMRSYADSQMHLELDLKANAYGTNWGYSVDETPANLPIMYTMSDSTGKELTTGMMTPMNAIDGSHYGTNLPKDTIPGPGDYMLKITIYPPKNYDLHQDYITGVPADAWFKPLSAEMPWTLTEENLDIVANNTVENPMEPSDNCKDYPKHRYEDETAEKAQAEAEKVAPLPMMS